MTKPVERGAALGLRFALELDVAGDLAFNAKRADALVTVRARSGGGAPGATASAEILIMDRSLSMASRGKIGEAKRAACAAIDAVRDGAYLGIVAGHHEAETVYPGGGGLARVDSEVREAAKRRVLGLMPEGGTAIGRWLTRAAELFASATSAGTVCHAALYTDGRNEHETAKELELALAACADRFVCDVRGLGHDWNYTELLRIAEALHGDAKAVVAIADLTADFTRLMEQARRLVVPRVYLGLHLNDRFRVGFVRQTRPVEAELTAQQQRDGREIHVPLGSWAPETRQYQLSLLLDADMLPVGEDMRAARVTLLAEAPDGTREQCSDTEPMIVRRHETIDPPARVSDRLTQAENAHELGMAMRACANAHLARDFTEADRELRHAVRLARELGDSERLRLLESITAVDENGVAQVRRDIPRGQMQQLGIESTRTGPMPEGLAREADPAPPAVLVTRVCDTCGEVTYGQVVRRCESCGQPLGGGVAGVS